MTPPVVVVVVPVACVVVVVLEPDLVLNVEDVVNVQVEEELEVVLVVS
jgi:hypothetical protein